MPSVRQDLHPFCTVSELKHASAHHQSDGMEMEDTATQEQLTDETRPDSVTHSKGQRVRRRISRACDQCNQLRTKCDGKNPCAHCVESGLTCENARARKKRGKASKKEIAAQQASTALADARDSSPQTEGSSDHRPAGPQSIKIHGQKRKRASEEHQPPLMSPKNPSHIASPIQKSDRHGKHQHLQGFEYAGGSVTNHPLGDHVRPSSIKPPTATGLPTPREIEPSMHRRSTSMAIGDYSNIDGHHRNVLIPNMTATDSSFLHSGPSPMLDSMIQGGTITGYGDSAHVIPSPRSQTGPAGQQYDIGGSSLSAMFSGPASRHSIGGSLEWLPLQSPTANLYHMQSRRTLRYPVLQPLLPYITAIIPTQLACDLLELYFSSTSSAFMQPQSPYVLGYIFRKRSFLRRYNPRHCSPALLASMLWIAAQTSESTYLTSSPSARAKICQKLLELTIILLKPLVHIPADQTPLYGENTVIDGVALGGFGVALPAHPHDHDNGILGASGTLDDVATYIHLATVVSASEYKAASLRWWNAAWSLARELKLNRELPLSPGSSRLDDTQVDRDLSDETGAAQTNCSSQLTSEEGREERRRTWWLLFSIDRHLALCYNRPLFLLDAECDGLFQPDNDIAWQAGEYYARDTSSASNRRRGPSFECTGHGIFGYFLPLMTILGEIVDLNHAQNHPRFGRRFRSASEWDEQTLEITHRLEAYSRSLQHQVELQITPTDSLGPQSGKPQHRLTDAMLQIRTQAAYSTHLMHTLHILLNGKWDPIALLDDNDLWISSQSFVAATAHAVAAAEALDAILEHDPDLSFMPFCFGIYLLQGSFLLLLIADKLQADASPSVVKACETIVRAHEACVATLNTEYQRNFRKVMRSALAQVRGRGTEDFGEQQLRRREVLALYRWTGDGRGLAL